MRDSMKYINHMGQTFSFGRNNVVIDENDFRNYSWTYNSQYNKITSFQKKIKTQSILVKIVGTDAGAIANELFEIVERDVLANKPGKMYVGDYYLAGYFYASKKSNYTNSQEIDVTLSFASDQAYWIKEYPYVFRINDEGSGGDDRGFGYNYGYPYDFSSPISSQNLKNMSFVPVNFILNVYGSVINPSIIIGGHIHRVNTTLENNEILTINSKEKTVIKTTSKGAKVNEFANRFYQSYIFEKVPKGDNRILCTPECNFDITLLEERSEPIWI